MNGTTRTHIWRILEILAQAKIPFYILPALMILLVAGTIAQAEMGLYAAQSKFFNAFILWAGPIPLPGGYTLIGILSFNLLLKFIAFSQWSRAKSGIILAHLGALVLLIGGLLTALTAREGFMVIAEGAQSPFVYDYHTRELMIYEKGHLLRAIPFGDLKNDADTALKGLPFTLQILETCDHCKISRREETPQAFAADLTPQGMATFMALSPQPPEKEQEANIPGLSFGIRGSDADGLYIGFDGMPEPIEFNAGNRDYKIIFGKQQRLLPFALKLDDFRKIDYPGSNTARGYESDVRVLDGKAEWKALIEMNAPLRYKGYIFYQSDFEQNAMSEITILSVVENKGRYFPYIGTGIIAIGLLIQTALSFRTRKRKS